MGAAPPAGGVLRPNAVRGGSGLKAGNELCAPGDCPQENVAVLGGVEVEVAIADLPKTG